MKVEKEPFWLCNQGMIYAIWTIKPRWNGHDFIHPTSGEKYPNENPDCLTKRCAHLLFPEATKRLRVGQSRKIA